jgi:hypothetical protein
MLSKLIKKMKASKQELYNNDEYNAKVIKEAKQQIPPLHFTYQGYDGNFYNNDGEMYVPSNCGRVVEGTSGGSVSPLSTNLPNTPGKDVKKGPSMLRAKAAMLGSHLGKGANLQVILLSTSHVALLTVPRP